MHVFEMVVLIVLIGGVVSLVNKYMDKNKNDLPGWLTDPEWTGDDDGMGGGPVSVSRIEKLEERVAVLEKIVTDRSYDLKKEFERL